jgi:hypothetical protein
MMSTRRTKMLGLGIAAIAFLVATIPVFHSGVLYADEGDHGDHDNGDHNNDGDHNNNCDNGDHDHGDCDHGDHDHEDHDGNND